MSDIKPFLAAVAESEVASGSGLYALVDHAGAPGLLNRLAEQPEMRWINLFSESIDEAAIKAAPLLLDLKVNNEQAWLRWLHDHCRESTSLTLLSSRLDMDTVAQGLKNRLDVMLPDGVPALLRYFDTRILEVLPQVLEPCQANQFFCLASCWLWLDRGGKPQRHVVASPSHDDWPKPFSFSEEQQNMMIDAAEADVLAQQMRLHGPDLCSGYSRAALHALARDCGAKANDLGIERVQSRTLFALACLQLGERFVEEAEWSAVLAKVRCREMSFEEAVRQRLR